MRIAMTASESNDAATSSSVCDDESPTMEDLAQLGHQLDAMVPTDASIQDELSKVAEQGSGRIEDARLAIARVIANRLIDERKVQCALMISGTGSCASNDSICPAFDVFQRAEKLETAGRDILATAILMPKKDFRKKLGERNDLRMIATHFDVPIGAVALRRRILQHAP